MLKASLCFCFFRKFNVGSSLEPTAKKMATAPSPLADWSHQYF